jgi:hypothetical protein
MLKKKMTLSLCFSLFLLSSAIAPCTFAASVETDGDLKVNGWIWSNSGGFKFPDGTTWTTGSMSGLLFNVGFVVDNSNSNPGDMSMGAIKFGTGATGEGIASQRIGSGNVNGLDLYTNSTARLSIANNGYVGIGTRTPTFPLDVRLNRSFTHARFGITAHPLFIMANEPQIGFNAYYDSTYKYGSSGYAGYLGFGQDINGGFSFATAPSGTADAAITRTVRMAITNDGKVGIGTTAPSQLLDVTGNINSSGNVTAGNITASGGLTGHDGYFTGSLNLDQGNNNNGGLSGAVLTFGNGSGEGIASKRTATGNQFGLDFYTGFNNRMSITNGGDVNIAGNLNVNGNGKVGMIYMGSGTGTTEAPGTPIIVRRAVSTVTTEGNIVATTDWLSLVRDGTNGGFNIVHSLAWDYNGIVTCMGMKSSGVAVNKYLSVAKNTTTQLYSDADAVVYFQCNFGDPWLTGRVVHVTLFRQDGDSYWLGTIVSDYNQ